MCNDRRDNGNTGNCIHDILQKICLLQKQEFRKDNFTGCEKPFLGPTPTRDCYNTRPVQLFNCMTGALWCIDIENNEEGTSGDSIRRTGIFRVESLDRNCCTLRLLEKCGEHEYRDTGEFCTINIGCMGAIRCLPDTHIDLC